jgi:adenosylcobinamide-GDP ribazoletransferase
VDLLRQYIWTLRRFTRLKPPVPEGADPGTMHLPGVGWLVGLVAAVSFALLSLLLHGGAWATLAAAVGSTIATILLTAAAGERAFEKLYGTLALFLAILAKVSLLAVLASQSEAGVLAALLAAHTLSRFAAHTMPEPTDGRRLMVAAAWCVPPLLLAMFARGPIFVALAMALTAITWWTLKRLLLRQPQPAEDDALGVTQQACEIAFYLGFAIA